MTYCPNPVNNKKFCSSAADKTYAFGRFPMEGWAEATTSAMIPAPRTNGTLSHNDRDRGRLSTKRSYARSTPGKVATESLPATAKRNSSTDATYHRLDADPPWR